MTAVQADRQRLLAHLLGGAAARTPPKIEAVPAGRAVPLSPSQSGIWFFCKAYPHSTEYSMPEMRTVERAVTAEELRAAVSECMRRHDALRLRIFERDGLPVQQDCGSTEPPVLWHDLRALDPLAAETHAAELAHAAGQRPIPVTEPLMFLVTGFALPGDRTLIQINFHHVIIDGWSRIQVVRELDLLLAGRPLPEPSPVGFLDFLFWQQQHEDRQRQELDLAYWMDKLSGDLPVLGLPTDRPRPTESSRRGSTVGFGMDPDGLPALERVAREEGTTLFAVVLAAYKVFLARLSGSYDLVVGTSVIGRDQEISESIVGCFVKTVALRTDLTGDPTFREAVRRVHATLVEAHDHSSVTFDQVVAELAPPRVSGMHPVFQTFVNLQPPGEASAGATEAGIEIETDAAKWDLTVSLAVEGGGLGGLIEYSADLFDRPTVQRFASIFARLLNELGRSPDTAVRAVALLSDEETQHALHGMNPYQRPDIKYTTMTGPFEEQARRTPDAVAVIDERESLSYAGLNERANRLAAHLRSLGVGRQARVGVCMERSVDLLVSLYAVCKTGAAYVPIDPDLPQGRMDFLLSDAEVELVLVDPANAGRIPAATAAKRICVDGKSGEWNQAGPQTTVDVPAPGPGNAAVHLLYTSGTTGRPKAVVYPIDGALANLFWLQQRYPFTAGDTALLKTSYGFDVSIWELFWPLYHGARLVVAPPGSHRDPEQLRALIEQYEVSTLFLVPSMMQPFLDSSPAGSCPSLRWMLCGGEPVTARIRDGFHARLSATLINCYGPTEAGSVVDGVVPIETGAPTVPLGRPAANFRTYLLDDALLPVPVGVPGEVYVGGEIGLGQSYHRRPGATAERFLPDPYGEPGTRMYRTGDLCKYDEDGVLTHLGRRGRQVKIRGMRIEPAEIESVLCEHAEVSESVVLPVEDRVGELAAFVVLRSHSGVIPRDLIDLLGRMLPSHMIPSTITAIDAIPKHVSGKVDTLALTSLARVGSTEPVEIVEPEGWLETRLAEIYQQVLQRDRISVTDSFFALGGHSLLVFKVIDLCAKQLLVRPSVRDVFTAQSVRALAARMSSTTPGQDSNPVHLGGAVGAPVLVFVHAASGSIMPFVPIAQRLEANFCVYALAASDTEDDAVSIQDLARSYVPAVDAVRGASPVVLVGWSMGGCVAIEMAQCYQRRGEPLPVTILLDTWAPPSLMSSADAAAQVRRGIEATDVLAMEGFDVAELLGADEFATLRRTIDRNTTAFLDYQPAAFAGPVDLLAADDPPPGLVINEVPDYLNERRGWDGVIADVTVHPVRGDHRSMLAEENADALAAMISRLVEERLAFDEI